MKNSKIVCVIIFQLIYSNCLFSQWLQLPNINTIPSYTPPPQPVGSMTYPVNIIPSGNKIIIWNLKADVTPSSGGYTDSYISKNDLSSSSCIGNCNYSPSYGCCGIDLLQSFNDSSYTYIFTSQGWYNQVFKIDNSTSRQYAGCPTNNSQIFAVSITNKSAYAISHYDYLNDTLLFVRTTRTSPLIQNTKKLTPYQSFTNIKLSFLNDSIGFLNVVRKNNLSKNILLKTIDFGNSWTEIYFDSINKIIDFHFPSKNVGFILKSNNTMFKTIDGGINWIQITNSGLSTFKCIKFANDTLGYVAGNSNALKKTINGGLTWTNEISGTANAIVSLHAFGNIAYFVDSQKKVYKNLSITGITELQNNEYELKIFPNPSNGIITINTNLFQNENFYIEICNLLGEIVYKSIEYNNPDIFNKEISLQDISSGIYTISLKNSTSNFNKKLVINKL
jgi:hypothetical protein